MNFRNLFFFILVGAMLSMTYGQERRTSTYTAFADTPSKVPSTLLDSLKNASKSLTRFRLIDSISKIHLKFGDTDSIISYGQMLEKEIGFNQNELVNRNYWLSKSYLILGKGKTFNGLFDPALGYHLKALELNVDDKSLFYQHQLGMAKAYYFKKEYDKALPLLLTTYENADELSVSSTAALYVALIYHTQEEEENSKQYIEEALNQAKQSGDDKLRMTIELYQTRMKKTEEFDTKVFNKLQDIKDESLAAGYYDIYTESVIDLSEMYIMTDNIEAAKMVLSFAHINAVSWNRWQPEQKMQRVLVKFYTQQKDYKNAYAIMTQYTALNEKIIKNQNYNAVKELEIKYDINKKEQEIDRQRLIKNSFLIGFLVLLVPVIALLVTYYQKLKTQLALNESQEIVNQQEVTALLKDQELKLIKASVSGEDKERKRIAQELHDSIGGNLASIKLQLADKEIASPTYKNIAKQLDDTYEQVRNLSHNLTAKKFEQSAFTQLISEYTYNINSGTSVEISFNPHPEDKVNAVDQHIQVEIFKVIQELLTNALKHAQATNIEIHLNAYEQKLTVLFEDDGRGFNIEKVTLGMGLNGMKNRIKNLSGTMLVDSVPRRGTAINIEIPV